MNKLDSNSIKLKLLFNDKELHRDLIVECADYFRNLMKASSCCVLDKKRENVIMILEAFYQRCKILYFIF